MRKSTAVKLFVLAIAVLAITLIVLSSNDTKIDVDAFVATSEARFDTCWEVWEDNDAERNLCIDNLKTAEAGD